MKQRFLLTVLFGVIFLNLSFSQNNSIKINATLNSETKELSIYQEIDFYNKSDSILNNIYFHNWANAYRDKKTPLAERFVEKNSKSFHFTSEKNRGSSNINAILVNYDVATWEINDQNPDILNLHLNNPLQPKDSIKVIVTYTVKVPNAKFTRYGVNSNNYNLRYWYLVPAIFDTKWQIYNNLDLDDLYMDYTNYNIKINVPKDYTVISDLIVSNTNGEVQNSYQLIGKDRLDVELNITQFDDFSQYNSKPVSIITNLNSAKLNLVLKTNILNRELAFIESYLGEYQHEKLLINRIDYDKDPVYGFNQLPSFLTPFSDNFEWDIKMFKVLVRKYINTKFLFNQREDVWLADGLQTYLMMKYVETYYPEMKAIGNISKIWGIRSFNLAKIDFNDKYYFVYQFASRKNLDQSLTTPADSLSNFNQKIANKYKAGIGIKYLENYLGEETITNAIIDFSKKNTTKRTKSDSIFNSINTTKDLDWFKIGYVRTNKKPDYSIKKVVKKGDSLEISIKNNRDVNVPIELFGIKDTEIKFRNWLTGIDSISKITIPKNGFEKLSLNYESLLPEYNLRNNWKN
ncbi:MAG: aminopeptidase, partial [Bacteroidetes bacterium]|nr:aminopeptidase [Bacteroidota bacterium]